ncbi:hypothetical protein ACHQM5_028050 [Ranunculus cassubicifolius]
MAFSGRFGNLLKQSFTQNSVANGQVSSSAMLNAMRCMSTKLFVGGLSYGTDDHQLRDAFANFGEVTEARVITDRDTGRSRGFGFVNFTTADAANSALSSMDGQDLAGRNIRVSLANERPSSGFGRGGGNYSSGSYGGGGGDRSFGGGDGGY